MMADGLIGLIDLFLVLVYFIVLLALAYYYKNKNAQDEYVQKYFVKGFIFKIFGGLAYALLVVYYWGFGDTATYFKEVLFFRGLLDNKEISLYQIFTYDYAYFRDEYNIIGSVNNSGFMVTKIAILFSYISFSRFLITTMLFSVVAYFSLFTLFKTFVSILPKQHFLLALSTIFFPSIAVYGSGILKDTVCIAALGWFFYSSYEIVIKRQFSTKHFLIIILTAILIISIKSYILAGFLIPFMVILITRLTHGIQNKVLKTMLLGTVTVMAILLVAVFFDQILDVLGLSSIDKMQDEIVMLQQEYARMTENNDSQFSIGSIEPTMLGLVKKMPLGFIATLFRPFMWEVGSLFTLLSAIESFILFSFTLYVIFKTRIRFIKSIFSDPTIFLCIVFSLIFASLVGLSTMNFGTLARYRIPVIPFYLMGLIMILSFSHKKKLSKKVV